MEKDGLLQTIEQKLTGVIDPETGANVIRMHLVQDLTVDENGVVSYTFRPSSPLCPLAIPLALMIHHAIEEVTGVAKQKIKVVDYTHADEVNKILNQLSKDNA